MLCDICSKSYDFCHDCPTPDSQLGFCSLVLVDKLVVGNSETRVCLPL